jgi:hypothetical protein
MLTRNRIRRVRNRTALAPDPPLRFIPYSILSVKLSTIFYYSRYSLKNAASHRHSPFLLHI